MKYYFHADENLESFLKIYFFIIYLKEIFLQIFQYIKKIMKNIFHIITKKIYFLIEKINIFIKRDLANLLTIALYIYILFSLIKEKILIYNFTY